MLNTTLCYVEKDNKYLMLHRVKKENDLNKDKWVGIGGKFEENETPDECMLREAYEETGLRLTDFRLRGVITFLSDEYEGEYMYLYTATDYEGELKECNEGNLEWVPIDEVCDLPIWEGDRLFFEELKKDRGFFTMKLRYEGSRLVEAETKLHTKKEGSRLVEAENKLHAKKMRAAGQWRQKLSSIQRNEGSAAKQKDIL